MTAPHDPLHGDATTRRLVGVGQRALETARNRLLTCGVIFALAFLVMAGRVVDLTVLDGSPGKRAGSPSSAETTLRADIVDRNGVLLATSLTTAFGLRRPEGDHRSRRHRCRSPAGISRSRPDGDPHPSCQRLALRLGAAGDYAGAAAAGHRARHSGHRLPRRAPARLPAGPRRGACRRASTDIDGRGIAGVEESYDRVARRRATIAAAWSRCPRPAHPARANWLPAQREFDALGAAGLVLDVATGDLVGMVSLPDFDPNEPVRRSRRRGAVQPRHQGRLRDGLDDEAVHRRHGARQRHDHAGAAVMMPAGRCASPASPSATTTASTAGCRRGKSSSTRRTSARR